MASTDGDGPDQPHVRKPRPRRKPQRKRNPIDPPEHPGIPREKIYLWRPVLLSLLGGAAIYAIRRTVSRRRQKDKQEERGLPS